MPPKITNYHGADGHWHTVSTPHEDQWDDETWQAEHQADVEAAQVIFPPG